MGSRWGRADEPRTTAGQMIEYIETVNKQGGVVTIDVGMNNREGQIIIAHHFEQLLEIGNALQNNHQADPPQ